MMDKLFSKFMPACRRSRPHPMWNWRRVIPTCVTLTALLTLWIVSGLHRIHHIPAYLQARAHEAGFAQEHRHAPSGHASASHAPEAPIPAPHPSPEQPPDCAVLALIQHVPVVGMEAAAVPHLDVVLEWVRVRGSFRPADGHDVWYLARAPPPVVPRFQT